MSERIPLTQEQWRKQDDCDSFFESQPRRKEQAVSDNPYAVTIRSCVPGDLGELTIDVYSIGKAYPMSDPVFHAVKKLLLAGKRRGDKSYEQDLREAIQSIQRELDDVTKGA